MRQNPSHLDGGSLAVAYAWRNHGRKYGKGIDNLAPAQQAGAGRAGDFVGPAHLCGESRQPGAFFAIAMKSTFLRPLLEAAAVLLLVLGAARWVSGLFSKRTAVYQVTAARQLRLLFWPLLALGAGLSVVPAVAVGGQPASAFEWLLTGGFVLFTLVLSGPALLLHLRYWTLSHATTLVFEPAANRLEVYQAGQRQPFERRDVARVVRATCRARRTFWARYDYLQLHLHDGRVLTLTSLLTELEPLATFLRSLPTERRTAAWCWV